MCRRLCLQGNDAEPLGDWAYWEGLMSLEAASEGAVGPQSLLYVQM